MSSFYWFWRVRIKNESIFFWSCYISSVPYFNLSAFSSVNNFKITIWISYELNKQNKFIITGKTLSLKTPQESITGVRNERWMKICKVLTVWKSFSSCLKTIAKKKFNKCHYKCFYPFQMRNSNSRKHQIQITSKWRQNFEHQNHDKICNATIWYFAWAMSDISGYHSNWSFDMNCKILIWFDYRKS